MTKSIFRKTREDKFFAGMRIANGKRSGFFKFYNEKGFCILEFFIPRLCGYQPTDEEWAPFFLEPFKVKSLKVKKPKDSCVEIYYYYGSGRNIFTKVI